MKKINLLIGFFLLFIFLSCEKKDDKTGTKSKRHYQLTVYRNNKLHQVFKFNDDNLLAQINYDTSGVIKGKIYFTYSTQQIRKDFYSKDSILLSYQIYKLNKNNTTDSILTYNQPFGLSDLSHAYIFTYSDLGILSVIMDKVFATGEHLDVDLVWSGDNVSEKKFPISTGFPQYFYEYDNKPSIYKLLKAPIDVNFGTLEVAETPISANNIKTVTVKKLVNNDFTYDTIKYQLYTSQLIYYDNGYLKSDLRQYNDSIIKFDYKLDTIK